MKCHKIYKILWFQSISNSSPNHHHHLLRSTNIHGSNISQNIDGCDMLWVKNDQNSVVEVEGFKHWPITWSLPGPALRAMQVHSPAVWKTQTAESRHLSHGRAAKLITTAQKFTTGWTLTTCKKHRVPDRQSWTKQQSAYYQLTSDDHWSHWFIHLVLSKTRGMITSNFAHTDTSYIILVVIYPITSPLISHEVPVFSWFSRQPTRYSEPRHTAATVGWRRVLLPCCTTVVSGATQLADNVENSGSCKAPHGGQCLDGSNSLGKEWNGKDDSDRSW